MFMYMFHIAFGIGLIALVMGLCMCKACCCKGSCEAGGCKSGGCHKWAGMIIVILAIISLVCLVNTGWKQMQMMGGMMGMENMTMEQMHKMKDDMKKDMGMATEKEKAKE
jgi:hypothetical protein